MKLFGGEFRTKIDSKGRLMVPAAFREVAGRTEGLILYGVPQPGGYIALMPEEEWNRIADFFTVDDPAPAITDAEDIAWFFSRSWRLVCDKQGRVVLPENLLKAVNMERGVDVVVVGMQRRIGIWILKDWEERIAGRDGEEMFRRIRNRVKKG